MTPLYDAVLFDLFGTLVDDRGHPRANASALLAGLPEARWAIVTSCPRGVALALLERAHLRVPAVLVTSDDVVRGKPGPECYLLAQDRLNAANCLVLEDSLHGVAAAKAAGMDVINVREAPLGSLALEVSADGRLRLRR